MATLVLKSQNTIRNPKYGKMPDLDSGLRFALDARDLQLQNGATVNRWVASAGLGSSTEKTFNAKMPNHQYPTYSSESRPSVKFNGSQQLINSNQDYYVQSATYIVVAKINNLRPTQNGIARIFCGDISDSTTGQNSNRSPDQWQLVAPFDDGIVMMTGRETLGSPTAIGSTIPFSNNWFVGVFVFDGDNSKLLTTHNSNIIRQSSLTRSYQDRVGLGINIASSDATTSGFDGEISFLSQYSRAFSDTEMQAAIDFYKHDFNF